MTGTADPWGVDLPPATVGRPVPPLPPRLAALAALDPAGVLVQGEPPAPARPGELPEVQALMEQGFRPHSPPGEPLALPAVWPDAHRCWVPDRLPRWTSTFCPPEPIVVTPHGEDLRRAHQDWLAEPAAEQGLPAPPRNRLWLLRSPWSDFGMAVVHHLIMLRAEQLTPQY